MGLAIHHLSSVLFACGLQAANLAETGRPLLQPFTPRDYRAHQQIWMGAQAPDGVLWFGNSHSALSYDGTVWRRIEVPTSFVRSLVVGPDGRVYVGGTDQLGFIAPGADGRDTFTSLLDALPADHRQLGVIWSMAATRDAVWFATDSLILRWRQARFDTWSLAGKPRQYLLSVADQLYVHRQGIGLSRFDGTQFTTVSDAPPLAQALYCSLEPLAGGGLLIGGPSSGLHELRNGVLTRRPTPIDPLLTRARPRLMQRMPDGTRVFDSAGLGVIITDADFNFLGRISAATGLGSDFVLSLTPDREGGVWVGTSNGVVRMEPMPRFTAFDTANGLPRGLIHDLRRHADTLFIAGADGMFRLVPANAVTGESASFQKVEGVAGQCWSLASHPEGLLVANGGGVQQLATGGDRRIIFSAADGVSKIAILPRHPDRLFVGRFTGLNVLRFEHGGWRDEGGVRGLTTEVRTIAESADGTLWLGTPTRGFIKVTQPPGATDDWAHATFTAYRETRGLPNDQGWSHVYSVGNDIVFVTDAGTFRYDAPADRFVLAGDLQIPGRHERTQLWPLAPTDRADRIWAQADTENTDLPRLLGVLTLHANGPVEFAPLPRKILERVAFGGARVLHWERDAAGETLWLGGPDGLVRADLSRPAAPAAAWGVLLRDCARPDGKSQTPVAGAAASYFPYGQAPLTFTFSAPRFGTGPGMRFQTRLLGYDKDWSPWSTRTDATFTHLWGGPFTFEARAQDPDGNVSAPVSFAFAVTPPWHLRKVAFALYALGALGAVLGFVRWRLSHAERERKRLEAIVAERTRDLAAARDQAEAASRAKSAFLAAMSHELRTPLNGVIGYAQLLQNDSRLASDQRERLRIVHQSGEHLLRMINDVLDLAKIEAGKLDLRLSPFALGELVGDVAAAHAPAAAAKRLSFQVELAASLPAWVEGDAQKLRQILDNLLGNAVKFTARGGVTLRVKPEAAAISFAIADTGPGIAPADRERLFQPFEQARAARPAAPGTGLGLAISRALVERIGGSLTLASEPDAGSTFSFSLPLPAITTPVAVVARPAVTGYEGPRKRILIVDDHAVNRRLLAELLTPLGFACGEFSSGESALARLASAAEPWPDLAIVDLRMAGLDGLEVTRRLRARPGGGNLRVLLTSASVISFNPAEARAAGCDDFLPKPFHTAELVAKLGALLALRWHEATPATASGGPAVPIPDDARHALREVLAQGDLEAFRAALARIRGEEPAAAARWDALDEAAAGFQLSKLRALLEQP